MTKTVKKRFTNGRRFGRMAGLNSPRLNLQSKAETVHYGEMVAPHIHVLSRPCTSVYNGREAEGAPLLRLESNGGVKGSLGAR